ncbi:MAG: N-acetylmuramoyl-L-alanine amidase [Ferruginibacter sp.]
MLPYAFYLLKVTLCSGILFGYYWLMLRNKIFHHYNRFYLLASIVLSLTLPLIKINIWHSANAPAATAIKLLQVVSSNEYLDDIVITARRNNFTAEQALLLLYSITSIIFAGLFIHMLVRIRILFIKHRHRIVEDIYFVNTIARGTPFSFLKYIFWNDHIDPETTTGRQIFKHELAHVQQKHSYDKLFVNAILIFSWCNPFFWLVRKELNMIHEFVADKIAVEDSDTEAFAAMILQVTYPLHRFQLTNPFFYSPIKRRLIMITKNKNPKAGYIGRVLVLPLAVLVFAAFTFKTKTFTNNHAPVYNGKKITVVIDAGHGGEDKGALSIAGNIAEKDLALSIIKKIKALNKNSNINIVFTRVTDVFQTVNEKASFCKAQHPDLFVSVHMGATTIDSANVKTGMSVWVSKDNYGNSGDSKLFASAVISEFANHYKLPVLPQPQQRETGIRVLQESPCPSVLIEAGYITNSNDLAFLQTDAGQEIIAGKILASVEKYAFAKEKGETGLNIRAIASNGNFATEERDTIPQITMNSIGKALIIIDGKTSSQKELKSIDPKNIESINVIKGKDAIAKYGDKGKNGVVIIAIKEKEIALNNVKVVVHENDSSTEINLSAAHIKYREKDIPEPKPLIVIDGKVQNNGFDLNSIAPDGIERIDVLKDKSAATKYGDKGINGVIEITTKSKNNSKEIPVSEGREYNSTVDARIVSVNSDVNQPEQPQGPVFTKTEYEPEFPGGDTAWKNYLQKNINSAMPIEEGWNAGTYKIIIEFIVDRNGNVSDVKTHDFPASKTAKQCIELIKNGPRWIPAKQNGKIVNAYKKQPITFVIEKG